MVYNCRVTDSIANNIWCQHHVKRNSIGMRRIKCICDRSFFKDRLHLNPCVLLYWPPEEKVRHDLCFHHFKFYIYSFVVIWNHKKVVKYIVISLVKVFLKRHWRIIDLVLNKKKETAVVAQICHILLRQACDLWPI